MQQKPSKKLSSLGIFLIAAVLGTVVITSLGVNAQTPNTTTAKPTISDGIDGIPDKVEYLRSLNFFSLNDYTTQTTFIADTNAKVPVLLASGAITVGASNSNTTSSFIGGGKQNKANAANTVVVGGANNEVHADNGLIL